MSPPRLLLVEGPSDENAVHALVTSLGLPAVSVREIGGITNVRRELAGLDTGVEPGVLHDAGETAHVTAVLGGRDVPTFCCRLDLEDELIRSLGTSRAVEILEAAGDGAAWRTIRNQPFHRDRPEDQVLRRFLGAGSGRKKRYAALLAAALAPSEVPEPLAAALDWATRR